jgi:AraC family transcriptional regulator
LTAPGIGIELVDCFSNCAESETATHTNAVFTIAETHGRALRSENRLIAHSQTIGWRSLYAAILEEVPFQATEPPIGHPSLIYHLCRPTTVSRKIEGGPREKALIGPRRFCLTPGTTAAQWEHAGNPEILQIYLRGSIYASAVNEMYGCDVSQVPIVPRFAILDPLLEQLAITITTALRDGTVEDGLYVDTLAHMIAVHLARQYSTRSRIVHGPTPKAIPGWKMRRLIEFVEENLDRDLSLEAMAGEVEISPLYLPRAFKTAVGKSPHQYVLARRIERARELLRDTDLPIVDVALSSGFSSQSHLSNWFLRMVGISPAAYRRQNNRS